MDCIASWADLTPEGRQGRWRRAPDTPRVVGAADLFAIQEKVIQHILTQVQEKRAVEQAPTIPDPIQQTVATVLRGYLNHPDLDRQQIWYTLGHPYGSLVRRRVQIVLARE